MSDRDLLAQRFEAHREPLGRWRCGCSGRPRGRRRRPGGLAAAQPHRTPDAVDNLGGWLTTVVARVCLDMLRARATKREVPPRAAARAESTAAPHPEDEALLADSVGLALLVVLDTLAPAERLAFVLHDMFAVPFEEIAPDRGPHADRRPAARQPGPPPGAVGPCRPRRGRATQREVVAAFLAAAREGDFDGAAAAARPRRRAAGRRRGVDMAASRASAGAPALSGRCTVSTPSTVFAGGARAARFTLVDGLAGAVVSVGGRPMAVFDFICAQRPRRGIELLADPETLNALDLEPVPELRWPCHRYDESGTLILAQGSSYRKQARDPSGRTRRPGLALHGSHNRPPPT